MLGCSHDVGLRSIGGFVCGQNYGRISLLLGFPWPLLRVRSEGPDVLAACVLRAGQDPLEQGQVCVEGGGGGSPRVCVCVC